jgi:glycosyltransferase involved in cell wall biosynthesis
MESDQLVSVVVPTYNRSRTIAKCLEALIEQSHTNIEIIISDDNSSDKTVAVVSEFMRADPRIKLIRSSINTGPAGARNRAIKEACGDYIFFTDDDVVVPQDWISKGLRLFEDAGCVGVEGQIVYVSSTYRPRYRDRAVGNTSGNNFMMANMAYKRDVLFEAGLLNESFRVMEDRDLALRVLKYGSIVFSKDFSVTHMREQRTVRSFFLEARGSAAWVQFDIINEKRNQMVWFVYRPLKLLALVFPPLIFSSLVTARFKSPFDYFLLLLLYPRLWYERILVWRWAIRYKKFII